VGLVAGGLLVAGCGSGDDAAIAQGVSTPTDLSGVTQNWDKVLPAARRFVVLAAFDNAAVLDKETGLVWEQSPTTTVDDWNDARSQCTTRTTGGRKGWRLPSVHELASLVDPSVAAPGPTLSPGHPFVGVQAGQSTGYLSASTSADNPTSAWAVRFLNGNAIPSPKNSLNLAWCVRGGMNADQY
jgi:hypothetical protein